MLCWKHWSVELHFPGVAVMSKAANDPIASAKATMAASKEAPSPYPHPGSPHKFTQPQLFAMLVPRKFFKKDYRGVVKWLEDWPEFREAPGSSRRSIQGNPFTSTPIARPRTTIDATPTGTRSPISSGRLY